MDYRNTTHFIKRLRATYKDHIAKARFSAPLSMPVTSFVATGTALARRPPVAGSFGAGVRFNAAAVFNGKPL